MDMILCTSKLKGSGCGYSYSKGCGLHVGYDKGVSTAEGGERACNSRTSCIEGEILAVTKSDTL